MVKLKSLAATETVSDRGNRQIIWFIPAIEELVDEYKISQPWKENKFYRLQFTYAYSYDQSIEVMDIWSSKNYRNQIAFHLCLLLAAIGPPFYVSVTGGPTRPFLLNI